MIPSGGRRREPSLADVARAAGVSAQTVSRVANGSDLVRPTTRDRVVVAMQELGYRPNGAARALKYGRYRSIGVIMFTLATYGNLRTLSAVSDEAARLGYSLTLISLDKASQASVSGAFAQLSELAVDGVVLVVPADIARGRGVDIPPGLPVVVIDSSPDETHPFVDHDQAQGARLATEHLLDLGHRTVWHIAGPTSSWSAKRRRESWAEVLRQHGCEVLEPFIGDWSADSGWEAGQVLATMPEVTAVFAANDQMALGLMRALHEAGRSVPGDVSVVGFDNTPDSGNYWPPLTTVHQHFEQVGRDALEALVDQIEQRPVGQLPLVATELVVRSSAAPPRVVSGAGSN